MKDWFLNLSQDEVYLELMFFKIFKQFELIAKLKTFSSLNLF